MAEMYNVTIIINPDKLVPLKSALNDLGIQGITVTHAEGCGTQHGGVTHYRGTVSDMSLLPKAKVEVIVSSIPVDDVIDAAMKVLKSDNIGAGKIFVYEVAKVVRVRTGERNFDALQYKK